MDIESYLNRVKSIFEAKGVNGIDDRYLSKVMGLIKERCTLLTDFYTQGIFFFESPRSYDEASVKPKWNDAKKEYFNDIAHQLQNHSSWKADSIEEIFKLSATEKNIKAGELQMIFRVMLVGNKTGPGVFIIAETIGKDER